MIVSIAYFLCVAFLGIPWVPWVLIPTAAVDCLFAATLPYVRHGPREKFSTPTDIVGEDDG